MKRGITMRALLEWSYREQRVRRISGLSDLASGPSAGGMDSMARVASLGALGCSIQSGGAAFGGSLDVHADAESVHAAVYGLPGGLRGLVMRHAENGTEPEWDVALGWEPKWGWDVDKHGAQVPAYPDDAPRAGPGRRPVFTEVVQFGSPEEVAAVRAVYASWWEALDVLAGHFRSHPVLLSAHQVVGVGAVAAPWEVGAKKGVDRRVRESVV